MRLEDLADRVWRGAPWVPPRFHAVQAKVAAVAN